MHDLTPEERDAEIQALIEGAAKFDLIVCLVASTGQCLPLDKYHFRAASENHGRQPHCKALSIAVQGRAGSRGLTEEEFDLWSAHHHGPTPGQHPYGVEERCKAVVRDAFSNKLKTHGSKKKKKARAA